ncbi:MAG: hypothetical protein MK486_05565 [Gemmatimonadetes bacterium]|nr:hypothetical protein [Gemmatimonadota bacterium]
MAQLPPHHLAWAESIGIVSRDMDFLLWFEETAFSTWMRESGPAFFSSLVLHSVAMGFVVGVHVATDLRVLGVACRVPLSLMRGFLPVAWVALWVVVASGALLLCAYPTKALTNPLFYVKLLAVLAALLIARSLTRGLLGDDNHDAGPLPRKARVLAALSLALWAGAITSGRLLAYTYNLLMASHQT